jgi:hypothetical protein
VLTRIRLIDPQLNVPISVLEPESKLTAEEPVANDRATNEHEGLMGRWVFFFARFQFAKLVEPGQGSFDVPARLAQAAAVSCASLGQERLYPLFLIAWRWGSES